MSESKVQRGRPKGSGLNDRTRLIAVARLISDNPALKPTTAIRSTGVSDPSTIRRLRDKFQSMRDELAAEISAGTSVPRTSAKGGTSVATKPHAASSARASSPRKRSPSVVEAVSVRNADEAGVAAKEFTTSLAAEGCSVAGVASAGAEAVDPVQLQTSVPAHGAVLAEATLAAVPHLSGAHSVPEAPSQGSSPVSSHPMAPMPPAFMTLWLGLGLQSMATACHFQASFLEKVMRMPHIASAIRGQVALSEMTLALCSAPSGRLRTVH